MRIAGVIAVLSLACGCFGPVASRPDGSASTDASVDAGIPCTQPRDCPAPGAACTYADCVEGYCTTFMTGVCDGGAACTFATDCTGSLPSVPWCTQLDAGILSSFSCINGRCLWECTGGRVCSAAVDAGCVDCTIPVGTGCAGSTCLNPAGTAIVESATCANPVVTLPVPFTNAGLTFAPQGSCLTRVGIEAGAPIGQLTQLSTGDFLADFPSMGGVCTGAVLPTNAERILVNCPGCQFVVRF